jgi:hypothetical protein
MQGKLDIEINMDHIPSFSATAIKIGKVINYGFFKAQACALSMKVDTL